LSPIGVDIGRRCIKAAQVRGGELVAAVSIRRTSDCAIPEPSELRHLRSLIAKGPFRGKQIVLAVPPDKLLTGIVELPPRSSGAPIEQLTRCELARIHRQEPASLEIDHWDLPPAARMGNRTMVMAMGCSHADSEALLCAVEAHGLEVLALDAHATAAARACAPLMGDQPGDGAILDVGWSCARLVLQYQGTVVYERIMDNGGVKDWSQSLSGDGAIQLDEAETLLTQKGAPIDDASQSGKTASFLNGRLESLAKEMLTPLTYLTTQYPSASVQRLAIMGGGGSIKSLGEFLGAKLELETRIARSGELVRCPQAQWADCGPGMALAIGLAKYIN
jgi:Tfp pilus assembly PilM family ATPase